MKTFKVSRQALAEVYDLVCDDYQTKIRNKIFSEANMFINEFEIYEEEVRQVYEDVYHPKHKEWLEKYLPLPKKKKVEIVGVLTVDGGFSSGIVKNISTRNNYKLITLANKTYSYDIFSAEFEGDVRVYYGHWNDGITED